MIPIKPIYRPLFRKGEHTTARIISLATGLAFGLMLLAEVFYYKSYDGFYPDAKRIYAVHEAFKRDKNSEKLQKYPRVSGAIGPGLVAEVPGVVWGAQVIPLGAFCRSSGEAYPSYYSRIWEHGGKKGVVTVKGKRVRFRRGRRGRIFIAFMTGPREKLTRVETPEAITKKIRNVSARWHRLAPASGTTPTNQATSRYRPADSRKYSSFQKIDRLIITGTADVAITVSTAEASKSLRRITGTINAEAHCSARNGVASR